MLIDSRSPVESDLLHYKTGFSPLYTQNSSLFIKIHLGPFSNMEHSVNTIFEKELHTDTIKNIYFSQFSKFSDKVKECDIFQIPVPNVRNLIQTGFLFIYHTTGIVSLPNQLDMALIRRLQIL